MKRIATVVAAMAIFSLCVSVRTSAAGESKLYVVGMRMDSSAFAGQAKAIAEKTTKKVSEITDYSFKFIYFTDDDSFMEAVKKNKLDFISSWNLNLLIPAVRKYGYQPFISYEVFGEKLEKNCYYVKKDSTARGIKDLKGRKAMVSDTFYDYYIMRSLLGGERPEFYFGVLKATKSFSSIFYSLSLDEAEVVFASESLYNFYKLNNPGPVKNIRSIVCNDGFARYFLLNAKKTPAPVVKEIQGVLLNAMRDESFKEFRPVLRTTKMVFYPVTAADFKPLYNLIDEAAKKGWERDYTKWLNMQQAE